MPLATALLLFGLAQAPRLPEIIRRRPSPPAEASTDAPDAEPAPPEPPAPPPLPRKALLGEWTLGLARGGTRCVITLTDHRWGTGAASLATASLGANCPPALFAVTRWRLAGRTLTLTNRSGRPIATLEPQDKAPGHSWTGQLASSAAGVIMEPRR